MIRHEMEAIVKEREIAAAPGVVHAPLVDRPAAAYGRRRRIARLARPAEFSDRHDSP